MGKDRLDGWKAIGAHFGRDRTTVIRWARQRGMPVHALPGGKTRTVFALRSELDAWARPAGVLDADGADGADETDAATPPGGHTSPRRGRRAAAASLVAGLAAALVAWRLAPSPDLPEPPLPRDPAAAALLIQARDDWAARSATSLTRSVAGFEQVTRRAPDFAPAYADLADAYLLEGEAGSLDERTAYERAQDAAEHALRLDPNLAAAHRALGFVAYWWTRDRPAAGRAFREALRLDPAAAQTHFWYANILSDNGERAAAAREFDRARLIDPGSVPIAADLAWSLWQAGRTDEAAARLERLLAAHPDVAEAHDCLGTIRFAQGDVPGYLHELHLWSRLRGEAGVAAYARSLDAALARGGVAAVRAAALAHELALQSDAAFPDHALAAFYASEAGDRAALLRVLALAEDKAEQWGSAGFTTRIAARWSHDRAVTALLARRAPPPIEPTVAS